MEKHFDVMFKCVSSKLDFEILHTEQNKIYKEFIKLYNVETGESMTFDFSYGTKPKENTHLTEYLYHLWSDINSVHTTKNFKDWCDQYGYDDDSILALKTYRKCKKYNNHIKRVLGKDDFLNFIEFMEHFDA